MAPEFFGNIEKDGYSYEIDYYAIGILFYELIMGYFSNIMIFIKKSEKFHLAMIRVKLISLRESNKSIFNKSLIN